MPFMAAGPPQVTGSIAPIPAASPATPAARGPDLVAPKMRVTPPLYNRRPVHNNLICTTPRAARGCRPALRRTLGQMMLRDQTPWKAPT